MIENVPASLDGATRSLVISIEDPTVLLEGRRGTRQAGVRWTDKFIQPGQFVALRFPDTEASDDMRQARKLYAVACSPLVAKRRSANLAASVIEVLVEKGDRDDDRLATLAPGTPVEACQPLGRGFCSLFDETSLTECLEAARPLLCVAVGARGVAALKAVLDWEPVQALAGTRRVTAYLLVRSPSAAPFLSEWETWREAGIRINPLYTEGYTYGEGESASANDALLRMLQNAIFGGEQGLQGAVGADPRAAAVLMSGVPGEVAAAITRRLTTAGIDRSRIMFTDY